jgi:hypothetical protein
VTETETETETDPTFIETGRNIRFPEEYMLCSADEIVAPSLDNTGTGFELNHQGLVQPNEDDVLHLASQNFPLISRSLSQDSQGEKKHDREKLDHYSQLGRPFVKSSILLNNRSRDQGLGRPLSGNARAGSRTLSGNSRTLQSSELEIAREKSLANVAVLVQKYARRFIVRRSCKCIKKILVDLAAAIKKREMFLILAHIIDLSVEHPWGGSHIEVVKTAKVLLIRLREEKKCKQLLENAILSRDINSLKSAINVHSALVLF